MDRVTRYAMDVLEGREVAGPHVRNACRRHLHDLEHGAERGLFFDREEVAKKIRIFEEKLKLSEGQFEGKPFLLHGSQAFIVGSLFGWKWKATGRRRFRRGYIEEGKGNGKSPLVGGIGLIGLLADGEAGAEVYSAGATKDQAAILFKDAVKMAKQSPEIHERVRFSGGEQREYNIAFLKTGSFFRPVSRETKKTGSGPRPHFALCDEVHEHPDRGTMEMLERGFKFRRQPLLLMTTNSGTDRNSVCWEEHVHAINVAAGNREALTDPTFLGEVIDDTTFSYVCSLDQGDDPLNDPSCWKKANPLLGVTIEYDYLAGVVAQAKAMPGKLNGILRLHFCVWTDADVAWMSREVLETCLTQDLDPEDHYGEDAWLGLDLSNNRDITAKATVVRTGYVDVEVEVEGSEGTQTEIIRKPTFDAWVEAWTPLDTLDAREVQDSIPYRKWLTEGHIQATQGQSVRFSDVAKSIADDNYNYKIRMIAYDRFAYKRFEEDIEALGLDLPFVEHPQGGMRKGKPTEEMVKAAKLEGKDPEGLWMPGSVRITEDAMLEGRLRILGNPVVVSAIMSAVVEEDKWGNRWLSKLKSANKIDAAVALCMAMGAANSQGSEELDVFSMIG